MQFENLAGEFFNDYALARYTSWRVGGKADRCYRPSNLKDLSHFLQQLQKSEPLTWLGLGSNVLIRDGGVRGTVIMTLNCLNELQLLDDHCVRAEAGVTCAKLAKFCVKHGFEEGVFFAGIPGTVGGALAMNAGAFGGQTWDHVAAVEMINHAGVIQTRQPEDFVANYRSVKWPEGEYFAAGIFRFRATDAVKANNQMKALLQKRNDSQPIGTFSCGSVFRNPPKDFAARLVEASGLKGFQKGPVCVSAKHANFILNDGTAKAAEIEELINFVQNEVYRQQGVQLIPEVHILGDRPV